MTAEPFLTRSTRPTTRPLADLAHLLESADEPGRRSREALQLLRQLIHYDCCALLAAPPGTDAVLTLEPELPPASRAALGQALTDCLERVSGRVEREGAERSLALAKIGNWRSHLAVPLVSLDRVAGLLFVGSESADAYDEQDLRLLAIAAAQFAAYLTLLRLRAWEAAQIRALETEIAERQRAEAALRASEERFRRTFEQAPVGVVQLDPDGRVEAVNLAYCRMLGYAADELRGRRVEEWTHPDDRAADPSSRERVAQRTIDHATGEMRYLRRDGGVVWVQLTATRIHDENGAPLFDVGIVEDITARKSAGERLGRFQALTAALAAALDPDQVAAAIIEHGLPAVAANGGLVAMSSEDGNELVTLGVAGYPPEVVEAWRRIPVDARVPIAEAVRQQTPIILETLAERHARYPHLASVGGSGGQGPIVAWPIGVDDQPLGGLCLSFPTDRTIDAADRDFLGVLAALCTQALQRAQLYDRLRASEERFRAIVETANEGIWLVDAAGRTLYANDRMAALLGTTPTGLRGRPVLEFVFPEDAAAAAERIGSNVAGRAEEFEFRFRRADGSEIWVLARTGPVRDHRGEIAAALGLFTDVTARRRAEEALRQSEHRFRRLFEAGILGIVTADSERIIEANDVFLAAVGYTREDLIAGRLRWPNMTPPEYAALDERGIAELRERGVCTPYEKEYVRKDGSRIPILIGATELQPDPLVGLCFVLDLSQRKALERLQEDFLAAASHDLKNPVGAVKGQAQVLRRRLRREGAVDVDQLIAGLETIDAITGRMTDLIDELIDVARLRAGQALELRRQEVNLVALAERGAAEYQRTTERHTIRVDAALPHLIGHWDARRIERVVANLLTNAIKYSPERGEIVVRVEREREADGSWAVLTVRDDGVGIPAADLPHVFERFRRGANVGGVAGSGIGLAGARQILAQHGGTITVVSAEGAGSAFTVRLPLTGEGESLADHLPT